MHGEGLLGLLEGRSGRVDLFQPIEPLHEFMLDLDDALSLFLQLQAALQQVVRQ